MRPVHALPPEVPPAEPSASYSGAAAGAAAATESSADANSFAVVASESAPTLYMTDGSPAAQDALQVAAPVKVSM